MHKKHPGVERSRNENAKIWRYSDFAKFVSLLDRQALFFCRADKLSDPFEGSFSKANLEVRQENYERMPKRAQKMMDKRCDPSLKETKKVTCINCWHINEYESAAMWKLCLKSEQGIAVQSTWKRLKESFNEPDEIVIGKVEYIDYCDEPVREYDPRFPFFYKRKSFEYERELRPVTQSLSVAFNQDEIDKTEQEIGDGKYVSVDLDILIEKIFVSPKAPKWFTELVKSVLARYNVSKEVSQSSLSSDPIY